MYKNQTIPHSVIAQTTDTDSTSSTMVGTRRNPNSRPRTPPPICQHCGTRGHVSDLCSRTHYTSTMPAFSCSNCLKEIVSCNSTDPVRFDVSVRIINCSEHRTTTARPPPPPSPTGPGTATSSSIATSSPTATSSTASTSTSAAAPSPTTTSTAPPPYTSPRADNTPSTSTAPPPYTLILLPQLLQSLLSLLRSELRPLYRDGERERGPFSLYSSTPTSIPLWWTRCTRQAAACMKPSTPSPSSVASGGILARLLKLYLLTLHGSRRP